MQSAVPVVDHAKSFLKPNSPFNIFNIVALVAILIIGYFLYKKFTEKFNNGVIKIESTPPKEEPVVQEPEAPSADDSTPK